MPCYRSTGVVRVPRQCSNFQILCLVILGFSSFLICIKLSQHHIPHFQQVFIPQGWEKALLPNWVTSSEAGRTEDFMSSASPGSCGAVNNGGQNSFAAFLPSSSLLLPDRDSGRDLWRELPHPTVPDGRAGHLGHGAGQQAAPYRHRAAGHHQGARHRHTAH